MTSISPQEIYRHIGTGAVPVLSDVRRDHAFVDDNSLIVGGLCRRPEEVSELAPGSAVEAIRGRALLHGHGAHRDGKLVKHWAADHCHALAGGTPILAIDMYEHSYHVDFGAKAGRYVDAFIQATAWTTADRLLSDIASHGGDGDQQRSIRCVV